MKNSPIFAHQNLTSSRPACGLSSKAIGHVPFPAGFFKPNITNHRVGAIAMWSSLIGQQLVLNHVKDHNLTSWQIRLHWNYHTSTTTASHHNHHHHQLVTYNISKIWYLQFKKISKPVCIKIAPKYVVKYFLKCDTKISSPLTYLYLNHSTVEIYLHVWFRCRFFSPVRFSWEFPRVLSDCKIGLWNLTLEWSFSQIVALTSILFLHNQKNIFLPI